MIYSGKKANGKNTQAVLPESGKSPTSIDDLINPCTGTGPFIPLESISPKVFALAAGELHGKIYRALLKQYRDAGRDQYRLMKTQVRELVKLEQIDPQDATAIDKIVDIVCQSDDKINVERLRKIRDELVDTDASPMAIVIAEIAVNSGDAQRSEGGAIVGADVGGAIGGGILGGIGGAVLVGAISSFAASAGADATE